MRTHKILDALKNFFNFLSQIPHSEVDRLYSQTAFLRYPLDSFAAALRAARIKRNLTQRELADKLHMSVRTIIEIERCKSSPKFETVATLARELNISLDAAVFQDMKSDAVSKSVIDFFAGKSEDEIQKYITLCQQADTFKEHKGD